VLLESEFQGDLCVASWPAEPGLSSWGGWKSDAGFQVSKYDAGFLFLERTAQSKNTLKNSGAKYDAAFLVSYNLFEKVVPNMMQRS
jgi:hypothetical protein